MHRSFLVPYDFSEHSEAALFAAADLARRLGADLHLLHVVQPPLYGFAPVGDFAMPPPIDMGEVREGAAASLRDVAGRVENLPGKAEAVVVEGGAVADTILAAAERLKADLIVMGTHGRTGPARVFLGSVTERTLRRAPCPVLAVPTPHAGAAD